MVLSLKEEDHARNTCGGRRHSCGGRRTPDTRTLFQTHRSRAQKALALEMTPRAHHVGAALPASGSVRHRAAPGYHPVRQSSIKSSCRCKLARSMRHHMSRLSIVVSNARSIPLRCVPQIGRSRRREPAVVGDGAGQTAILALTARNLLASSRYLSALDCSSSGILRHT